MKKLIEKKNDTAVRAVKEMHDQTITKDTDTKPAAQASVSDKKVITAIKKVDHTAPDIETVNKIITEYNNSLGEIKEFNPLPALLDKVLRCKQYQLKDLLYSILTGYGYEVIYRNGYLYAKGDIPIMLCAHMDTVHEDAVKDIYMSDKGTLWSPQGIGGDDRCGIYTILMCLRSKNKPYILFTEDEEIGCVGAEHFTDDVRSGVIDRKDIDINFIVEIDRKGADDSVYYDCDNPEFEEYINSFGFWTSYGSCSDISYVAPALGVAAVNLSCGYYDQHTLKETIVLSELYGTIQKVRNIIADAADPEKASKKFDYIEKLHSYKGYYSSCYDNYYQWKYGNYNSKLKRSKWATDEDGFYPGCGFAGKYVSPVLLEKGAYIIADEGDYIYEYDTDEEYYIDASGKLYVLTENDEYDLPVVIRLLGTAYTQESLPYRFNENESEMVYVI